MRTVKATTCHPTLLGRLGENETTRVEFDVSKTLQEYPNAVFTLVNCLPGNSVAYPVSGITVEGNSVYWIVTSSDLSADGSGNCELIATEDGKVRKSDYYQTVILEALDGSGNPPPPWNGWQGTFTQLKQDAVDASFESEAWATGNKNGVPVPDTAPQYENNAEEYARQAKDAKDTAVAAKNAILGMSASATTLDADDPASASYSEGTLTIGVPVGTTYTPVVDGLGNLSWTNDGGKINPQGVNIPDLVRDIIDVAVTGTTPTITGEDNHRYTCGEVSTITITPPSTGIIDVIFTSGSTATVLTCTGVTFPAWFDPDNLDADTIYEINIAKSGNNYLGVVTAWEVT